MFKLFACAALLALSVCAFAEDKPKTELPKPDADGFITLFNGTDLTGWEGLPGIWSVKDGAITGSQQKDGSKQTNLILSASRETPEKFGDFELRLKYKMVTPDGNSGIQIRSKIDIPKMFHAGGYQCDIDSKGGYTGIIYDENGVAGGRNIMSNRGEKTVYDENNKRTNTKLEETGDVLKNAIHHVGDWNDVVIVARGKQITYTINGKLMTDMTDNSTKALKDGVIAFQSHAGFTMDIQFKDVKIKFLDAK